MDDLILKKFKDFEMFLIRNDKGISKALQSSSIREPAFTSLIQESVKPGDICMDIGANIGYVTMLLAFLSKSKVYAVEPDKRNFEVLCKNIVLNKFDVETDCLAIFDKDGSGSFYTSSKSNLGSLFPGRNTDGQAVGVKVKKLDTYLKGKVLPVFYKMDVEGAEVPILNGMHEIAKRSAIGTKILIEVHPREYSPNLDMRKALESIVGLGFSFKYVVSAGLAEPMIFRDKGYKPIRVYNCGSVWKRGVYEGISNEDAIDFCSTEHKEYIPEIKQETGKSVRAIMLEKTK